MTFHPRMQSRVEGITVVEDLRCRAWRGIVADVWNVECAEAAGGEYLSPYPRLFVVLDREGDGAVRLSASPDGQATGGSGPIHFVPAETRVWSRIDGVRRLTHLDVHFDVGTLQHRFGAQLGEKVDPERLSTPRLGFSDDRLFGLAKLFAVECMAGGGLDDLYGESLALALFVAVLGAAPERGRERGKLAPRQLRRVQDFLEEHCQRTVRLSELAALAGLSPSHFCHAFKASTGTTPHRWQMQARIGRVKQALAEPALPLTLVAASTGFSDQAHLTRVFRQMTGTTPAAWRRARAA